MAGSNFIKIPLETGPNGRGKGEAVTWGSRKEGGVQIQFEMKAKRGWECDLVMIHLTSVHRALDSTTPAPQSQLNLMME